MMHREDRAVDGGAGQFIGQPGELGVIQFAMVLAGDARVEHDDAQPVQPHHLVDGTVVAQPAQQLGPESRPIIVITHPPHDLGAEPLGDRLGERREFCVGGGLAAVGEISGEDDRLGTPPGSLERLEHLAELGDTVDAVVQATLPRRGSGCR